MSILGLHHVTLVAANAQRTVDFYTRVLGLRLVKTTVNFDDPGSYHLYFADETGGAGTVITFFEWPRAPRGRTGIGGTHHIALRVPDQDALLRWKRRLSDLGIRVRGPWNRQYFTSIYFRDPDGVIIEIATDGPGLLFNEHAGEIPQRIPPAELVAGGRDEAAIAAITWPEPVPTIDPAMSLTRGMHHITAMTSDIEITDQFLGQILGMALVKKTENFDDPGTRHWSWGTADARPGSLVTYLERRPPNVAHTWARGRRITTPWPWPTRACTSRCAIACSMPVFRCRPYSIVCTSRASTRVIPMATSSNSQPWGLGFLSTSRWRARVRHCGCRRGSKNSGTVLLRRSHRSIANRGRTMGMMQGRG